MLENKNKICKNTFYDEVFSIKYFLSLSSLIFTFNKFIFIECK